MSSCLSGGRPAYGIDLDIIKSSSTSTRSSHSSSPSSTISESSNSTLAISTRKQRTPRKRPNQTYSEAAALLSTAYPNIFLANDFSKPCKFTKPYELSSFSFEDSLDELLIPLAVDKPAFQIDSIAFEKPCSNDTDEYGCQTNSSNLCDRLEDFDAESILDEETEEGVLESIMGDLDECVEEETNTSNNGNSGVGVPVEFCYGYPLGLGLGLGGRFDLGFGMNREGMVKAFKQNDAGDWWRSPAVVNVGEISPRFNNPMLPEKLKKKKKKKKKLMSLNAKPSSQAQCEENSMSVLQPSSTASKQDSESNSKSCSASSKENSVPEPKPRTGMLLKLNYDEVLEAWSDKGSLFTEDLSSSEFPGTDALARLAQIDLFGENVALREASVQRYKEKRRTRLFSKKIRYQVRKVNADQRPRMKGRFVRKLNSSADEE
ncbi:hypothetical protein RND81_08G217500 [Saponaria officinalis]|uniref:CCT domain-containing protein n=1 Tax=Saponaria officinalis TaxID=3572 RepID=A0AAW1JA95_SAPOF